LAKRIKPKIATSSLPQQWTKYRTFIPAAGITRVTAVLKRTIRRMDHLAAVIRAGLREEPARPADFLSAPNGPVNRS